jgi:hypothetical protein
MLVFQLSLKLKNLTSTHTQECLNIVEKLENNEMELSNQL